MLGGITALSTSLDVPTLLVVATCVTALLGLVLLFVWIQDRSIRALAWWGSAYLIGGSAVALWARQWSIVPYVPADVPSALLFLTCGMVWNGARLFQDRTVQPVAMSAGALIWLFACRDPGFAQDGSARVILSSLIICAYTFLTAFEFWRERRRPLFTHWSAIFVPALHGGVFLVPAGLAAFAPSEFGTSLFATGWFALFALETLLYAVGTAFIMLLMTNERTVQVHKTAASTDALTGLFNRRAFFEAAPQLIERQTRKGEEIALLMFDLDRFKSINDRFGHAVGDEALKVFAATASGNMRANDVLARLGGEEFAVVIASGLADACSAAERLRAAFEVAGREFAGRRVEATVSIGVAAGPAAQADIETLLALADKALYRAKKSGRNRVQAVDASSVAPARKPKPLVVPVLGPEYERQAPDRGGRDKVQVGLSVIQSPLSPAA